MRVPALNAGRRPVFSFECSIPRRSVETAGEVLAPAVADPVTPRDSRGA